jgi:hypothetical protein
MLFAASDILSRRESASRRGATISPELTQLDAAAPHFDHEATRELLRLHAPVGTRPPSLATVPVGGKIVAPSTPQPTL